MVTASQSQTALRRVTDESVATAAELLARLKGSPDQRRYQLLETVPSVIDYFAQGSAALAADFYDEARDASHPRTAYASQAVVNDRTVKIRRGIAWASAPLFTGDETTVEARLREIVQPETARPYRDTITTNRRRDPDAVGWRRVAGVCCRFCAMLADRGAVYKTDTARFAAHPHCDCTAEPVFRGGHVGPEASALQYVASLRTRTPAQRAELRAYLDAVYPQ